MSTRSWAVRLSAARPAKTRQQSADGHSRSCLYAGSWVHSESPVECNVAGVTSKHVCYQTAVLSQNGRGEMGGIAPSKSSTWIRRCGRLSSRFSSVRYTPCLVQTCTAALGISLSHQAGGTPYAIDSGVVVQDLLFGTSSSSSSPSAQTDAPTPISAGCIIAECAALSSFAREGTS